MKDLEFLWIKNSLPQVSIVVGYNASEIVRNFAAKLFSKDTLVPLDSNSDFYIVTQMEDKSEIIIDQIRKAIDFLNKTPGIASKKILLIELAENMNINASNALLKHLEEPSQNTYIFLTTNNISGILDTILSRCAIFYTNQIYSSQLSSSFCISDECRKWSDIDYIIKIDKASWPLYKNYAISILSGAIKFSARVMDKEHTQDIEFFAKSIMDNIYYLLHIYDKVKKIILDAEIYELDRKHAALLIHDLISNSIRVPLHLQK